MDFTEVDGIQDFYHIPLIDQHFPALDDDGAFRVRDHIGHVFRHLHQIRLHIEARLAGTGPPITITFLFLAYFGFFGRLLMVSRSVWVRMMLFSNTGSMYGSMSFGPPHEAFCQVLF